MRVNHAPPSEVVVLIAGGDSDDALQAMLLAGSQEVLRGLSKASDRRARRPPS